MLFNGETGVIQSLDDEMNNSKTPVAAFKFKKGGPELTSPAPIFGQHTHQVLGELGYSDDEIEDLHTQGIIALARSSDVST